MDMEMRKMIKLLFVSFVCSVQQTAFAGNYKLKYGFLILVSCSK